MIAILTKGKRRGELVNVIQWCNDWFMVEVDGKSKIVSPSMIAITPNTLDTIRNHKNNGTLFGEFEVVTVKNPEGLFMFTFKRR